MGRRKTTRFGWVRSEEPTEADRPDAVDLVEEEPERAEAVIHRERMSALGDLGIRLSTLSPAVRHALPLDPEVIAELDLLASLGNTPARRRQALRVRAFLRDVDPALLADVLAGGSPDQARLDRAERWRTRLLAGDDDALQAFVDEHPDADRQLVRTLIREARGDTPAASRAGRKLFQVLKATLAKTV